MIAMESGVLAMCNGEKDIRIWDLNNEEHGSISLRTAKGYSSAETITCISYSNIKGCLSGGTSEGKVANWKRRRATDETLSEQWNLQEAISIGSKVELVRWATVSGVLAVSACSLVTLLKEQPILADANADVGDYIHIIIFS
ncbi:unnamed protein product [Gongylonema pulchrum]|uniref:WD_REPEATS_REGION domain-containing protein n=1 Tax=Gongylonema pulchrum TaxID=637853 RepID=A0A183E488_9BILA|nr:unnamed protein product [Gongylonema pulchrum]